MSDNLINDVAMYLDLNEEPVDQSVEPFSRYGSMINELETAHGRIHERIRQLEAVTARARQRQSWRQARNSVEYSFVSTEQLSNMDSVGLMGRGVERGKGCKRDSSHLVAKALEMDSEVKEVDKEGGSFYDCNICFEMAEEPILTCCGHLYCWACFYTLPYIDSTAKECPVCEGEVIDTNIIPIFGNGNCTRVSEVSESGFTVPPRPKAQRVESVRQQRVTRGLSHIAVAEALRRIRTSNSLIDENFNEDTTSQNAYMAQSTDSLRQQSNHFSRVLSESAVSLSTISSTLNNAERLVDNLETYIGDRLVQRRSVYLLSTDVSVRSVHETLDSADIPSSSRTADVSEDAVQLEYLVTSASPAANLPETHSSSSLRRRSGPLRLSDAEREYFRQIRRRRLN